MICICLGCGYRGEVEEDRWKVVSWRCKVCGGWLRGIEGYLKRKKYERRKCKVCGDRVGVVFDMPFSVLKGGRVRRYGRGRCCMKHGPKLDGCLEYVDNRELWQAVMRETWHPPTVFVGRDWFACLEGGAVVVYRREACHGECGEADRDRQDVVGEG